MKDTADSTRFVADKCKGQILAAHEYAITLSGIFSERAENSRLQLSKVLKGKLSYLKMTYRHDKNRHLTAF